MKKNFKELLQTCLVAFNKIPRKNFSLQGKITDTYELAKEIGEALEQKETFVVVYEEDDSNIITTEYLDFNNANDAEAYYNKEVEESEGFVMLAIEIKSRARNE